MRIVQVRPLFSPTEPTNLRPGERIVGSAEARDEGFNALMTEWFIGREVRRRRQGHARHNGRRLKGRG